MGQSSHRENGSAVAAIQGTNYMLILGQWQWRREVVGSGDILEEDPTGLPRA